MTTPGEAFGFPPPPAVPTPHADALRDALDAVTAALDAAHADGLEIPQVAATGASNLMIVHMIIAGQELQAAGEDPLAAVQLPDSVQARLQAALHRV